MRKKRQSPADLVIVIKVTMMMAMVTVVKLRGTRGTPFLSP